MKPRRGKEVRSPEMLLFLFILLKEKKIALKEAAATEAKLGKVTFLIQGNIFSSARKKNDTRADLVVSVIEDRRSTPPGKKARLWGGRLLVLLWTLNWSRAPVTGRIYLPSRTRSSLDACRLDVGGQD